MLANGQAVDGTWELTILVTDMGVQRPLRVRGDMHIGGVMLRLVEEIDITRDWSDHALWWPAKNIWLLHTRSTLDQVGASSESLLYFTPMHKMCRVQLPDLQYIDARLNFAVPAFNSSVQLCHDLGIRYPEELAFKRYLSPDELRKNAPSERRGSLPSNQYDGQGQVRSPTHYSRSAYDISNATPQGVQQHPSYDPNVSGYSLPRGVSPGAASLPVNSSHTPHSTLPYGSSTVGRGGSNIYGTLNGSGTPFSVTQQTLAWESGGVMDYDQNLAQSPRAPSREAQEMMFRPKDLAQKANCNRGWLDSSRSLMEQGIVENGVVELRFKFMQFFDVNPKFDPVRINQMYEQARWMILLEELDCTDEEAFMFAALQLQVQLQSNNPQSNGHHNGRSVEDEVEAALDELEITLEGTHLGKQTDITSVPELCDYLRYMKPRKLTWKGWRRCFFTFKDLNLSFYRTSGESQAAPLGRICLKGCEVTPDLNIGQGKFVIKILVPSAEGMTEFWIRCEQEQQYSKWMAACKLAAKGKTMADAGYLAEVENIRRLLDMQHPMPAQALPPQAVPQDLNPDEYLPQRCIRKLRTRGHSVQRILEAHAKVRELGLTEAKMQYLRAWQSVPEFGVHYFVIKLKQSRKPELLAITYNRMTRMSLESGEALKTWRFSTMNKWHVNWEIKRVLIQFEEEDVEFACLSADCKVPHEFIGGYIFLSMRSKDQNQVLNEELFHKLTGGRMAAIEAPTRVEAPSRLYVDMYK